MKHKTILNIILIFILLSPCLLSAKTIDKDIETIWQYMGKLATIDANLNNRIEIMRYKMEDMQKEIDALKLKMKEQDNKQQDEIIIWK